MGRPAIDRLVAGLDSEQLSEREKSSQDLEKLGMLAEPALRKALAKDAPPEMRRRIKALLDGLKIGEAAPEQHQASRGREVLECLATPEARPFVEKLAEGSSGPWHAREAKAALVRLDRRNARHSPRR